MPAIFISYRRDDTLSAAGRLADYLVRRFGPGEIFRDLEAIEAGADFRLALLDAIATARVMLLLIGRAWAALPGADGRPRLHDESDYVRLEIQRALAHDVPIVPVLVEGGRMPGPGDLPESIRPIAFRQAHTIDDAQWHRDADDLVALVARATELTPTPVGRGDRTRAIDLLRDVGRHIGRVPLDLLRLLYEPRRLLLARGSAGTAGLLPALVFVIVSQVLGGVLVLQAWPTRSPVLQFVLAPAVQVLLAAIVVSAPLYLAWRLAGGPRQYARMLVVLLYQSAFVGCGTAVMMMTTLTGMGLSVPAAVDELAQNPSAEAVSRFMATAQAAPNVAPWVIGALITSFILVGLGVWLLGTWPVYRHVLHQPRSRSWMALALFVAFCAGPLWALAWVAVVLRGASP